MASADTLAARCASRAPVEQQGAWVDGDAKEWLTSGEVARILGVERTTVWRTDKADLPYRETRGRQRRYNAQDVEEYKRRLDAAGGR